MNILCAILIILLVHFDKEIFDTANFGVFKKLFPIDDTFAYGYLLFIGCPIG